MIKKILLSLIAFALLFGIGWTIFHSSEIPGDSVYPLELTPIESDLNLRLYPIDEGVTLHDTVIFSQNDFGLSFWVKPNSNEIWTTLFSIGNKNDFIQLSTRGNPEGQEVGINLSIMKDGQIDRISAIATQTLLIYQFNFIYISKSDNLITLYLNGEAVASKNVSYNNSKFRKRDLFIGMSDLFDDPKFTGEISDLRFHGTPLNKEEIKTEYLRNVFDLCQDAANIYNQLSDRIDLDFSDLKHNLACSYLNLEWKYDKSKIDHIESEKVFFTQDASNQDQILKLILSNSEKEKAIEYRYHKSVITQFDKFNEDKAAFIDNLPRVWFSGDILPSTMPNGTKIEWSTTSQELLIRDYKLEKSNSDSEKVFGSLSALLKLDDYSVSIPFSMTILDQPYGYLMAYFYDSENLSNSIRLAYSLDGLNWVPLNHGDGIIYSEIENSTQWLRDPYILRTNDGNFVILATQGWDTPEVYFWRSENLLDFKDNRLIQLSYFEPGIGLTGQRAWAPEIYYSGLEDRYFFIFSDPLGGPIYVRKTSDFDYFTYPQIYFDPGYPVIDASIDRNVDGNFLYYKDERPDVNTVFSAFAPTLDFSNPQLFDSGFINKDVNLEGPFVLKDYKRERKLLYVDQYYLENYSVFEIKDPTKFEYEPIDQNRIILPDVKTRHGSVTVLTKKELERIISTYR